MIKTTTSVILYASCIILTMLLIYLRDNFIENDTHKAIGFISLYMCFLPLILIFTFRYNVGTDYMSYRNIFYKLMHTEATFEVLFRNYVEIGWVILTYLALVFSKSFAFFELLIAIIFFVYLTLIIQKKNLSEKLLIVFLTFVILFLQFMNISRQALAMIILIYSMMSCTQKKYKISLIHIIVASLFHSSALIFIPIVFVVKIYFEKEHFSIGNKFQIKEKWIEWILLASPIYSIPLAYIISFVFKILNFKVNYIANHLNFDFGFLLYTLPVIFIYKFLIRYYKIKEDKQIKSIYFITLISIFFQSLGCLLLVFERLSIYFFDMYILLFALLFERIELKKNKRVFYILIYSYFILYFVVMYILMKGQGVFPYRFI